MKTTIPHGGWTSLFALWSLQGLTAGIILAALPTDTQNGLLLGLSASRLALLSAILLFTLTAAWLSWNTLRPNWLVVIRRSIVWDTALLASLTVIFLSQSALAVLHGLSQGGLIYHYAAYASRLAPLLNLLAICAIELVIWLIWLRREALKPARPITMAALLIWLGLGIMVALAATTGFGIRAESVGVWSKPAIPFLEWQILIAWAVGTILLLSEIYGRMPRLAHPDFWIGLAVWVGVSVLWLSQPVNVGWLAGPRAPNFEPYPFSDALTYDQFAQSILIGDGMDGDAIPPHPLYVVFLAGLHGIGGQDYRVVIALQSLVLAAFPLALYFIGKEISGRPLGIMLAILAATRDVMTGYSADFAGNFSFSKFYLTELPAALLLSLFLLFLLKGAKRPALWNLNFVLAGGFLGLAALVRTQSLIILPAALLPAFLSNRANLKDWGRAAIMLVLAASLTIAPWLWRNYQITGSLLMDDPYSQMGIRASWYSGEEEFITRLPGENDKDYSNRLVSIAIEGVRTHPGLVTRLVSAHFVNNEFGNLMVLPVREDLYTPAELFRPTRAFWDQVDLDFSIEQSALLALYLLLFSLGVAAAWRTAGWAGLMPLAINLAYNFSNALFMSSGMRFLLVADWGFYLYYALGLLTVSRGIFLTLDTLRGRLIQNTPKREMRAAQGDGRPAWKLVLGGCLLFFLLGSSLPMSEKLVPERYPPLNREQLIQLMTTATTGAAREELTDVLADSNLKVLRGRALYPRYYGPGEGELNTEKIGYATAEQGRLVFTMVGDAHSLVILNLPESPVFFPNAADVVLVARQTSTHLQAVAVLVESGGRSVIFFASDD
jgi:hypothetical protein